DVRHVGNAQRVVAGHRTVDDIHRIEAQHGIDEAAAWSLPAFDLVLAHIAYEIALLGFSELGKAATAMKRLTGAIDRAHRRAIEIRIRRAHIEDAGLQQRFLGGDRNLLIHEVGYASLARTRDERLAQRFERGRLLGGQSPERNALRTRRAGRKQHLDAAHREGKRADPRASHEGAPFDLLHVSPPFEVLAHPARPADLWRAVRRD